MNRQELLRSYLDTTKLGLEVGPSHTPTARRHLAIKSKLSIIWIRQDYEKNIKDQPVDTSSIEVVDYVWSGQSFVSLTEKPKGYSWILASHVIEHTPDLIAFLNNCDNILQNDGVLVLAIPDQRYCFDHFRSKTQLSSVIDAHLEKRTRHSPGIAAEVYLNFCKAESDWMAEPHQIKIWGTPEIALSMMNGLQRGEYIDMHA